MAEGKGDIIDAGPNDYRVVSEVREPVQATDRPPEIQPDSLRSVIENASPEVRKATADLLNGLAEVVAGVQGRSDASVPESWKRQMGVSEATVSPETSQATETPALTPPKPGNS
ncbi:MAG: hypothetical protein HY427_02430 [Candidatus Levybacteria bacterium]|nr:hypothetical protein [Candidatus Levybacteria bacterium]